MGLYHEAVPRIDPSQLPQLSHWEFDPVVSRWIVGHPYPRRPAAFGIDISPRHGRKRAAATPPWRQAQTTPTATSTPIQSHRQPPPSTPVISSSSSSKRSRTVGSGSEASTSTQACAADGMRPQGPELPSPPCERIGFRREGASGAHALGEGGGDDQAVLVAPRLLQDYKPPVLVPLRVGTRVWGRFLATSLGTNRGSKWYQGAVVAVRGDGTVDISYDDGEAEDRVAREHVRTEAEEEEGQRAESLRVAASHRTALACTSFDVYAQRLPESRWDKNPAAICSRQLQHLPGDPAGKLC